MSDPRSAELPLRQQSTSEDRISTCKQQLQQSLEYAMLTYPNSSPLGETCRQIVQMDQTLEIYHLQTSDSFKQLTMLTDVHTLLLKPTQFVEHFVHTSTSSYLFLD